MIDRPTGITIVSVHVYPLVSRLVTILESSLQTGRKAPTVLLEGLVVLASIEAYFQKQGSELSAGVLSGTALIW